jgi:FkbH-like protein
MYQLEWGLNSTPQQRERPAVVHASEVDESAIERVYQMVWAEHCVECAIPDCYAVCPLYVRRGDGRCARFRNGIQPNPEYSGMYPFGADISFRRWAKLEAELRGRTVSLDSERRRQQWDRRIIPAINSVSEALSSISPKRKLNGAYKAFRDWQTTSNDPQAEHGQLDEFIVEVWNPSPQSCQLIVESFQDQVRSRHSLAIAPGRNLHRVPYEEMNVDLSRQDGRIYLYPDSDNEVRLIFTWLGLVGYAASAKPNRNSVVDAGSSNSKAASTSSSEGRVKTRKPAAKVKCLVWDLDNTLWQGTLAEDGAEACQARPELLQIVRLLDERGIVQSIASKNDHDIAWAKVKELGVEDYFLYPMINWGPKSDSIEAIARELNIGVDTLAFIDDSAVERAQVADALPQVRVYAETELGKLLSLPEFDVPVTSESKLRRISYLEESRRKNLATNFVGGNEEFLRSCRLVAELFAPVDAAHQGRCLELLQRSNQLNLTSRRYDRAEFDRLLAQPELLKIACSCHDRFGDYGTVGFAVVDLSGAEPLLRDFVFSCRVAKKKVENAFLAWLLQQFSDMGYHKLTAQFVPTERNGALRAVIDEVGFVPGDPGQASPYQGAQYLELLQKDIPWSDIVTVSDQGVDLPTAAPASGRGRDGGQHD